MHVTTASRQLLCNRSGALRLWSSLSPTFPPQCVQLNPHYRNQGRALSATVIRRATIQDDELPQHIKEISDRIVCLSLHDSALLIQDLMTRLNMSPAMLSSGPPAAAPSGPAGGPEASKESAEDSKPAVKTQFNIKLVKLEATAKAKVIREIKNLISGLTLVEAKKFVESVPKTVKEGVLKDEAEQIKKTLEAVGATVELE